MSQKPSGDFVEVLAETAWRNVEEGYYDGLEDVDKRGSSFKAAIERARGRAIIAEIKPASPSAGVLRKYTEEEALGIALEMVEGGAAALSILTEPRIFNGSLRVFQEVRKALDTPLLMKDIVVSGKQVEAASRVGADAILLIAALFNRGLCEEGLDEMIDKAHDAGLEVLLETHSGEEFEQALRSEADMIGINNRNLATLEVNLETTPQLLAGRRVDRVVVSESGIESAEDIRRLRMAGVDAFLVGTSIMRSTDVRAKVRELAEA